MYEEFQFGSTSLHESSGKYLRNSKRLFSRHSKNRDATYKTEQTHPTMSNVLGHIISTLITGGEYDLEA